VVATEAKRPAAFAAGKHHHQAASGFRHLLVPIGPGDEVNGALALACTLAPERGATVRVISVVEIPAELPFDAHMFEEEATARRLLLQAREVGESHGVTVEIEIVRGRSAGEAIVAESAHGETELIVLRKERHRGAGRRILFGSTVDYVLNHAPCPVMVVAPRPAAHRPVHAVR
jgi:basic amino acid/polyamine antiporter, APA family